MNLELSLGKQWRTTHYAYTRCTVCVYCLVFLEVVIVAENWREIFWSRSDFIISLMLPQVLEDFIYQGTKLTPETLRIVNAS